MIVATFNILKPFSFISIILLYTLMFLLINFLFKLIKGHFFSILDQKQKQVIPYHARGIGNFDGRLLIHSSNSVHGLIPVPWNFQVEVFRFI